MHLEVVLGVEVSTVDRSQYGDVRKGNPEELHQIEGQRWRGISRNHVEGWTSRLPTHVIADQAPARDHEPRAAGEAQKPAEDGETCRSGDDGDP